MTTGCWRIVRRTGAEIRPQQHEITGADRSGEYGPTFGGRHRHQQATHRLVHGQHQGRVRGQGRLTGRVDHHQVHPVTGAERSGDGRVA